MENVDWLFSQGDEVWKKHNIKYLIIVILSEEMNAKIITTF